MSNFCDNCLSILKCSRFNSAKSGVARLLLSVRRFDRDSRFLFRLEVSLPRYPWPDIFACWREMISSGFLFLANECLIHNMHAWSSIFVSHLLALVLLPRSLGRKATSLVIFFVLSYAKSVVYVCLLLFAHYLGFVGFLGENFVYGLFLTSC